jgi:hypothetical protein
MRLIKKRKLTEEDHSEDKTRAKQATAFSSKRKSLVARIIG